MDQDQIPKLTATPAADIKIKLMCVVLGSAVSVAAYAITKHVMTQSLDDANALVVRLLETQKAAK